MNPFGRSALAKRLLRLRPRKCMRSSAACWARSMEKLLQIKCVFSMVGASMPGTSTPLWLNRMWTVPWWAAQAWRRLPSHRLCRSRGDRRLPIWLYVPLVVIHVIVAVALILIVLLQAGKGAGIGAAFGGASQTVFGPRGPGNFLSKLTTAAAGIFMITSLVLAILVRK